MNAQILAAFALLLPIASTVAQAQSSDGPDLYFEFAGGAAIDAGKATLSTGIDLDDPQDIADAPDFNATVGTAISLGAGIELTDTFSLGIEGNLVSHNASQTGVEAGEALYDLEASASALGGLVLSSLTLDLNGDFAMDVTGGIGYFRNTTSGTLKTTRDSVTSSKTFEEHTRFGLGYALGAGISFAPSDNNRFGIEYRFQDAGPGNSAKSGSADDDRVVDFGNLQSHQLLFGVTFNF